MIKEIKGDITQISADVIINAANTELIHGGGVAKAIAKSAGEELEKESREIGFVPLGEFTVTTAGKLKAKKVIHISTIDYKNNKKITYQQLEKVWQKVLEYCRENNFKTIATPLLGTGIVGLDKEKVKEMLKKIGKKFEDLEIIIVDK
jgi:O-acetyl-ADP-ribose deacetylase (regulator of RNase III)